MYNLLKLLLSLFCNSKANTMGEHIEPQLQEMFLKGNEKIAKFMGGEFRTELPYTFTKSGWFNTPANDSKQIAQNYDFKYHSSWDWLKPVIDKIINMIGLKTVDECTDEEWRYYTMISRMWIGNTIVEAWVLVEDFVCFYNSGRCSLNKD